MAHRHCLLGCKPNQQFTSHIQFNQHKDLNQYITGYSNIYGPTNPSSLEDAYDINHVHIQGLTTVTTNNNYGIELT